MYVPKFDQLARLARSGWLDQPAQPCTTGRLDLAAQGSIWLPWEPRLTLTGSIWLLRSPCRPGWLDLVVPICWLWRRVVIGLPWALLGVLGDQPAQPCATGWLDLAAQGSIWLPRAPWLALAGSIWLLRSPWLALAGLIWLARSAGSGARIVSIGLPWALLWLDQPSPTCSEWVSLKCPNLNDGTELGRRDRTWLTGPA